MVHASLKRLGPVVGGPAQVVQALVESVGPNGTVMAYVSWDRSPYEETLNGATLTAAERDSWPAFDPATAATYRGFGVLNGFLCKAVGARRSGHPDASIAAVGARAEELVASHPIDSAYGPGSPLEKLVALDGQVLLLGAPLDSVTLIHYSEALAQIPGKRRVSYEMPVLDEAGRKVWLHAEDFDSNGITEEFAREGAPDAVETIARQYARLGRHRVGRVGSATCHLFGARDLASYGIAWLEHRYGRDLG